jgi:hypothetical protein
MEHLNNVSDLTKKMNAVLADFNRFSTFEGGSRKASN